MTFNDAITYIRIQGRTSSKFETINGLRQGWNIILEKIVRRTQMQHKTSLPNLILAFEDDIDTFRKYKPDVKGAFIPSLGKKAIIIALKINESKYIHAKPTKQSKPKSYPRRIQEIHQIFLIISITRNKTYFDLSCTDPR